jgi:hypothetical protein
MNLLKRFFPITAMAALVFTAIAVGPVYKKWSTPVRAAAHLPATVVLSCVNWETNSGIGGAQAVTSSDSTVVLPAVQSAPNVLPLGDSCALAIQKIRSQGFELQGVAATVTVSGFPSVVWTFTRGGIE